MYQRNVLTEHVAIIGPDFWGNEGEVRLEPAGKPGWYIREIGGKDILIEPRMIACGWRHLVLKHPARLHTIEHLLALRWMLDGVRIVPGSPWLPYSGDASIFWNAVKDKLASAGELQPCRVGRHISFVDPKDAARAVSLNRPTHEGDGGFTLYIHVKYADLPEPDPYVVSFPCTFETFEQVATAKTPAWPPRQSRAIWKFGQLMNIGPREHMVGWLGTKNPLEVLRGWQQHRALDALGALAAGIPPRRMLTGTFSSHRAGHRHDVGLLRIIESVGFTDM